MKNAGLMIQLFLYRYGWWPLAAGILLVLGLIIHLFWVPQLGSRVAANQAELQRVQQALADPHYANKSAVSPLAKRHAAFMATLAPKKDMQELVKTVFDQAQKFGLTLTQAEYKLSYQQDGGYYTYQMLAPVKGAYPELRRFVDGVLEAVPAAALEEVWFKRDGIASGIAEAKLRFVFYLKDGQS